MPEEKGLGSKILGLFVETRDDGTPAEGTPAVEGESAADVVAGLVGGAVPKPAHAAPTYAPPPLAIPRPTGPVTAANVDFDAVFKNAGMDPAELDRVRKAEELLKSLPEATPNEVKRQIVEASLKAFGFDVAKIASSAQGQLKALDTWVRINEQGTAKAITEMQQQIAQLEEKVIGLRAEIMKKTETLASTSAAADARKAQVHRVLEFFKVAVPPPPAAVPAAPVK